MPRRAGLQHRRRAAAAGGGGLASRPRRPDPACHGNADRLGHPVAHSIAGSDPERNASAVCNARGIPAAQPIIRAAGTHGRDSTTDRSARPMDALGMVVYQGTISSKLWAGAEPDITVM